MPENGPRTPEPRGQDQPRVTSSAIPATAGPAAERRRAPSRAGAATPAAADATDVPRRPGPAARPDDDGRGRAVPPASGSRRPAHAGAASRRARRAKAREGRSPLFLWLKEVATVVVVAIVLSFLIKTFLFRAFYIPSESMVNTLDVNDRIFVNLLVPEPFALQRGDVVVFRDTQGWLAPAAEKRDGPFTWVQDGLTFVGLLPDNSEQHLVKRVIGLPGDHVVCCDAGGQLTVNGAPAGRELRQRRRSARRSATSTSWFPKARSGSWATTATTPPTPAPTWTPTAASSTSPTSKARPPSSPGR